MIMTIGCTAHGGNLLFQDVCAHAWPTKIINTCVKLAKFFRNHTYTCTQIKLRTIAFHRKAYVVVLHGETRFAGIYYVIKRLIFLHPILREMCASGPFRDKRYREADEITAITVDAAFWAKAEKLRKFLKPLKCFIKLMDHDCHCSHHVWPGM